MNWKKSNIRKARKVDLAPVLKNRGLTLVSRNNGNFVVAEHDDLLIKKSYWRWPSRDLSGNSIDYFILIDGKSFNDSMTILKDYCSDTEENMPATLRSSRVPVS